MKRMNTLPTTHCRQCQGAAMRRSERHTPQIMADAPPYGIARTSVLAMLGKSPMMLNEMPNTCSTSSIIDRRTRPEFDLGEPVAQ
jgi:hypothetical protein